MGKITKVVYVCDICDFETENEKELKQCFSCGKDVCENCSQMLRHVIESDDAEIFSSFQLICRECGTNKEKLKEAFKKEL